MTLLMLYAADVPVDPIWLRTLATVLPVVSAVVVAVLTGPKLIERLRERRQEKAAPPPLIPPPEGPGIPTVVTVAAVDRASTDPIIRLFIDDLHQRLNLAHAEAAELHRLKAIDAGTIATLTSEIADKEARLNACELELSHTSVQNRQLISRLEQLKFDLESTQRKLAICLEGKRP